MCEFASASLIKVADEHLHATAIAGLHRTLQRSVGHCRMQSTTPTLLTLLLMHSLLRLQTSTSDLEQNEDSTRVAF